MRYKKTELGQTALQNRALALMPRQRSAFIMFDGKRSVEDVIKATAGLGVTIEDVHHLVSSGLLAETTQPVAAVATPAVKASSPVASQAPAAAGNHFQHARNWASIASSATSLERPYSLMGLETSPSV